MYKPPESNVWVEKDILVKMGYIKMEPLFFRTISSMSGHISCSCLLAQDCRGYFLTGS